MTYTGEVYPTNTRSQAYGLFLTFGRIGTVIMPFLIKFWNLWTNSSSEILLAIFFSLGFIFLFKMEDSLNKDMVEQVTTSLEEMLIINNNIKFTNKN